MVKDSLLWLRPSATRPRRSSIISVLTQAADHLWDALGYRYGIVLSNKQVKLPPQSCGIMSYGPFEIVQLLRRGYRHEEGDDNTASRLS